MLAPVPTRFQRSAYLKAGIFLSTPAGVRCASLATLAWGEAFLWLVNPGCVRRGTPTGCCFSSPSQDLYRYTNGSVHRLYDDVDFGHVFSVHLGHEMKGIASCTSSVGFFSTPNSRINSNVSVQDVNPCREYPNYRRFLAPKGWA